MLNALAANTHGFYSSGTIPTIPGVGESEVQEHEEGKTNCVSIGLDVEPEFAIDFDELCKDVRTMAGGNMEVAEIEVSLSLEDLFFLFLC